VKTVKTAKTKTVNTKTETAGKRTVKKKQTN
jgi:hypothetical protein